jgi:hypothetical protein
VYVGDDESFSHKMTMKENKKQKTKKKEFHTNEKLYCCYYFLKQLVHGKNKNKTEKQKINDF